jgi:hypothetical protein
VTRRDFIRVTPLAVLAACRSVQPDRPAWLTPERVEALAAVIAYVGATAFNLVDHDQRQKVCDLQVTLQKLVDAERWDIQTLAIALQRLPVGFFDTRWGMLSFQLGLPAVVMLTDALGLGNFNAKDDRHVKALIVGITRGVTSALTWTEDVRALRGDDPILELLKRAEIATRS